MKISVIHPSRSRPEKAAATAKAWLSSAKNPENIEYIVSIDVTDELWADYVEAIFPGGESVWLSSPYNRMVTEGNMSILRHHNDTAISAINRAAEEAQGDIFVVVSDDFSCPDNWDEDLLTHLEGKSDFVAKTTDGLQKWIITLPIMDRLYYNRFGYIYPPHIKHMFSDTWMTHVADLLGRKITIPMTFKHNHYTTGLTERDSVNMKNDSTWMQGQNEYLKGVRENFGLNPEEIKGRLMCDMGHANWLRSQGVNV